MGECWLIALMSTFPLDGRLCDEAWTSLTFLLNVSGSPVTTADIVQVFCGQIPSGLGEGEATVAGG